MDLNEIKPVRKPLRAVRVRPVEEPPEGFDAENIETKLAEAEESYAKFWAEDQEQEDVDDPIVAVGLVDKGFTNEPAGPAKNVTRDCPVCPMVIGVPDTGPDTLGIGMSLQAANELEDEYGTHLAQHSTGEFVEKIRELQALVDADNERFSLRAPEGFTPLRERHPEVFSPKTAEPDPPPPTPFDLTPAYRQDIPDGVVGIKGMR